MLVVKKTMLFFLIITMSFLFTSCNFAENIENYKDYENDCLVEITISSPGDSYYFICTDSYQIVTHDNRKNKTIITEAGNIDKGFLNSCLESILENGAYVEPEFDVSDYYSVGLYIGENDYHFTYGLSSNPYANMLVEMIIGSCDYKPAQESLVPFPSTFR